LRRQLAVHGGGDIDEDKGTHNETWQRFMDFKWSVDPELVSGVQAENHLKIGVGWHRQNYLAVRACYRRAIRGPIHQVRRVKHLIGCTVDSVPTEVCNVCAVKLAAIIEIEV